MTVVVPSYNQAPFLEECLRSILLQNQPGLEIRVYDGGSDDGSVEILERYAPFLDHWQSAPDRGQSHAINLGFAEAGGDFLAWLNSDDLYEPGALVRVAQAAASDPSARLISGACALVDETGDWMGIKPPFQPSAEHLLSGGSVPGQPAQFLHREVLDRVGPLREDLHYLLDWELWLRISLQFPPSATRMIQEPLARARIWHGAKTPTAGTRGLEERRRIVDELREHELRARPHLARLLRAAEGDLHWRWAIHLREGGQGGAGKHLLSWALRERSPRRVVKRILRLLGLRTPGADVTESSAR